MSEMRAFIWVAVVACGRICSPGREWPSGGAAATGRLTSSAWADIAVLPASCKAVTRSSPCQAETHTRAPLVPWGHGRICAPEPPSNGEARSGVPRRPARRARYQAFGLLRIAFTVAPTVFGEADREAVPDVDRDDGERQRRDLLGVRTAPRPRRRRRRAPRALRQQRQRLTPGERRPLARTVERRLTPAREHVQPLLVLAERTSVLARACPGSRRSR